MPWMILFISPPWRWRGRRSSAMAAAANRSGSGGRGSAKRLHVTLALSSQKTLKTGPTQRKKRPCTEQGYELGRSLVSLLPRTQSVWLNAVIGHPSGSPSRGNPAAAASHGAGGAGPPAQSEFSRLARLFRRSSGGKFEM